MSEAFDDVACVRLYQTIREGVGETARRLGVGRNLFPPSPAVERHLGTLMQNVVRSGRLTTYESPADARDRALVAELLDRYLGLHGPGFDAADVHFTHGAQEAISVVCGHGARRGLAALLPLPTYYSFEQSSRRWGMPLAGHYRWDGLVHWAAEPPPRRLLEVLVVPNGVTGSLFAPPAGPGAELTLVDCVFQLGAHDGGAGLAAGTREVLAGRDLERTALVMTVSKDLSLPGLRAGVLVTKSRELMRYARADRFERLYAPSPLAGQVVALYLALLLLHGWRRSPRPAGSYADLAAAFFRAQVPLPAEEEMAAILQHLDAMARRSRANLALLGTHRWLELAPGFQPIAGYSVLPRVLAPFAGEARFIDWIRDAGVEHDLKLNPHGLFGGTPEVWSALYPGEHRMRVNLSEDPAALAETLRAVAALVECSD